MDIHDDFIKAIWPRDKRNTGMVKEDNRVYIYALVVVICIALVFAGIYTAQQNAIERVQSTSIERSK